MSVRSAPEPSDGALLAAYASRGDEAAFTTLVERHGAMVRAACTRLIPTSDVDDATQAVFVLLAERAQRLRGRSDLGGWLHRAAVLTSRRVLRDAARRARRDDAAGRARLARSDDPIRAAWEDIAPRLDRAIDALPARYRESIVLCYLEGRTQAEAAALLGRPAGTIATRCRRGLAALRRRLGARGERLSLTGLSGLMAAYGSTKTPVIGAAAASPAATALAKGVGKTMWWFGTRKIAIGVGAMALASVSPLAFDGDELPAPEPVIATVADPVAPEPEPAPVAAVVPDPEPRVQPAPPRDVVAAPTPEPTIRRVTLLSRRKHRDYEKATFSFEHGVRDDPDRRITRNDWDLQYGNGEHDPLTVNMVTDDRSRIADLGPRSWDTLGDVPSLSPFADNDRRDRRFRSVLALERAWARTGHVYLVHTRDRETDLVALFRVESLVPGDRVTISWRLIEASSLGEPWRGRNQPPAVAKKSGGRRNARGARAPKNGSATPKAKTKPDKRDDPLPDYEPIGDAQHATLFSWNRHRDFERATLNVEHGRGDAHGPEEEPATWDVLFGRLGADAFEVMPATDGEIVDLGEHTWDALTRVRGLSPGWGDDGIAATAVTGHVYLYRRGGRSPVTALIRVERLVADDTVDVSWKRLRARRR